MHDMSLLGNCHQQTRACIARTWRHAVAWTQMSEVYTLIETSAMTAYLSVPAFGEASEAPILGLAPKGDLARAYAGK